MKYYSSTFASVYGSCTYGNSQFDNNSSCTTTAAGSTDTGSSAGGLLANTGFDFLLVATIVCVVAFTALVVRFLRKPARPAPKNGN
jgi:hypothetical protein